MLTTNDCKDFLVNHFKDKNTKAKDWKRVSKYKVGDVWYRDFSCTQVGTVTLKENSLTSALEIHAQALNAPLMSETYTGSFDTSGDSLNGASIEDFLLSREGELNLISQLDTQDEMGRPVQEFNYDIEGSSRNLTFGLYPDGSWYYYTC